MNWRQILQLFPDIDLAAAIFDQVEDSRIDAHVLAAYPGIRALYRRVADSVRAGRPRLALCRCAKRFLKRWYNWVWAGIHWQ